MGLKIMKFMASVTLGPEEWHQTIKINTIFETIFFTPGEQADKLHECNTVLLFFKLNNKVILLRNEK